MGYTGKDLAVRHVAATRADAIGFQGVVAEADGSLTASDGHALANVRATGAQDRSRAELVPSGEVKDMVAKAKALKAPVEPPVGQEIVFKWQRLVPSDPPERRIVLSPELLGKIAKVATEAFGKAHPITLEFRGQLDPIVVRARDGERELVGLVAPRWPKGMFDDET